MPLEINEIGIRMRVSDASSRRDEEGEQEGEQAGEEDGCCEQTNRAQMVEDCVQRVLKILKAQRER